MTAIPLIQQPIMSSAMAPHMVLVPMSGQQVHMMAAAQGGVPRFARSFPHMMVPINSSTHGAFAVDLSGQHRGNSAPGSRGPLSSASSPSLGSKSLYFQASSNPQDTRAPRVRRTFKELFRELECPHETCTRRYASRSSLATHVRLKHSPEAKQQQEEAKQQRKKSMEKTVTPRPVRPRAHSLANVDIYRHSTGNMMPLQFTTSTIGTSLPNTSSPAMQTWTPVASRLHSPSSDSLVHSQSTVPSELTSNTAASGGHGAAQRVPYNTDPLSFSSPYGPRGSTATTRANSVASLSISNFGSPAMSMHNFCSVSSDNLAQPIQAITWNDMLLSNLELDLGSFDSSAAAAMMRGPAMRTDSMGSAKSEPILHLRNNAVADDEDMHEMHMLLSGLQSSAGSPQSMMTDRSDQLETISETDLPNAA